MALALDCGHSEPGKRMTMKQHLPALTALLLAPLAMLLSAAPLNAADQASSNPTTPELQHSNIPETSAGWKKFEGNPVLGGQ